MKPKKTKIKTREDLHRDKSFRFIMDSRVLAAQLKNVGHAVDCKSNVMVLRCVLLDADEAGALRITGYDHRLGIRSPMNADVEGDVFPVAVPFSLLSQALVGIKGDIDIRTSWDGDLCKLHVGGHVIDTIPGDEFPPFPEPKKSQKAFDVSKAAFRDVVKRTVFATNPNDPRQFMGGVFFTGEACVATDGHRLSIQTLNDHPVPEGFDAIIPTTTLLCVDKLFGNKKQLAGDLHIERVIDGRAVSFQVDDYEIVSRTIDAKYPNYKKVRPDYSSSALYVTFDTAAMDRAVKSAKKFALVKEKQGIVEFTFNAEAEEIIVHAETQDRGSFTDTVSATFAGSIDSHGWDKTLKISFNGNYMNQMLAHGEPESTLIIFGELKPAKMSTRHGELAEDAQILMPIKI